MSDKLLLSAYLGALLTLNPQYYPLAELAANMNYGDYNQTDIQNIQTDPIYELNIEPIRHEHFYSEIINTISSTEIHEDQISEYEAMKILREPIMDFFRNKKPLSY